MKESLTFGKIFIWKISEFFYTVITYRICFFGTQLYIAHQFCKCNIPCSFVLINRGDYLKKIKDKCP